MGISNISVLGAAVFTFCIRIPRSDISIVGSVIEYDVFVFFLFTAACH